MSQRKKNCKRNLDTPARELVKYESNLENATKNENKESNQSKCASELCVVECQIKNY